MQWTDRIRQVKIILVTAAVLIAVASLFISQYLVRDLFLEERHKMEVWAEAMRSLNNADENTDLNLVLKVIDGNNTIPVIVLDKEGKAARFAMSASRRWTTTTASGWRRRWERPCYGRAML